MLITIIKFKFFNSSRGKQHADLRILHTELKLYIYVRMMCIFFIGIYEAIYFFSRICPIFQISNVTGENIDLLKMFLNLLSARSSFVANEPAIFQIDDTYSVPVNIPISVSYVCLIYFGWSMLEFISILTIVNVQNSKYPHICTRYLLSQVNGVFKCSLHADSTCFSKK